MWRALKLTSRTSNLVKNQSYLRRTCTFTLSDLQANDLPVENNPPISFKLDDKYPGTASVRMQAIQNRVKSLKKEQLNGEWHDVRSFLLWAGGLKNMQRFTSIPVGTTARCFNDFNHCDVIAVKEDFASPSVEDLDSPVDPTESGLSMSMESIPELGPGLSWYSCMVGCNENPPADIAHLHYKTRIAFKLVWVPPYYKSFVLVDNDGELLNKGTPKGQLPDYFERQHNFKVVAGSKYAKAAVSSFQWDSDVEDATAAAAAATASAASNSSGSGIE